MILSTLLPEEGIRCILRCMDDTLIKTLEGIGYTPKESRVYLALLELGQGDVTDIAKVSGLKRSIVYVILKKLVRDGYVSSVTGKRVQHFTAVDPIKLFHNLQSSVGNFKDMLPLFRGLYQRLKSKPRFHYFEGIDGVMSVYREIERFPVAAYISSTERLQKYISNEVDKWVRGMKSQTIKTRGRHLLSDTSADQAFARSVEKYNQEVRFLPKGTLLDMDFSLYGNNLAITSLHDPVFIVVVESTNLVRSFLGLFDILWNTAPKR